jgi:hypothetical protein
VKHGGERRKTVKTGLSHPGLKRRNRRLQAFPKASEAQVTERNGKRERKSNNGAKEK